MTATLTHPDACNGVHEPRPPEPGPTVVCRNCGTFDFEANAHGETLARHMHRWGDDGRCTVDGCHGWLPPTEARRRRKAGLDARRRRLAKLGADDGEAG